MNGWNRITLSSVLFLAFQDASFSSQASKERNLLDYESLSHDITLKYIRAGNHDPEGLNHYYFRTSFVGLLDDSEEHILPLDQKKKLEEPYRRFAEIELASFRIFSQKENKKEQHVLAVEGDALRDLVRKVMNAFSSGDKMEIPESKVGVKVRIELFERQKKFYVIDEDNKIASAEYFAIPFGSSDQVLRQDSDIEFGDKQGLRVKLRVTYKDKLNSEQ